jgi:hypothetical protein
MIKRDINDSYLTEGALFTYDHDRILYKDAKYNKNNFLVTNAPKLIIEAHNPFLVIACEAKLSSSCITLVITVDGSIGWVYLNQSFIRRV